MPDDDDRHISRRKVRQFIDEMLQARRDYAHYQNLGSASGASEEALHANLQTSVMAVWEALRPYAVDHSSGRIEHIWTEAKLWPTSRKVRHIPVCQNCSEVRQGLQRGEACPECRTAIDYRTEYITDDEGEPVCEYKRGVKSLYEYQGQTEVVQKTVGTYKPKTKTVERPVRLKPEYLFRAARLLDELASELNIIGEEASPIADPHEMGEV